MPDYSAWPERRLAIAALRLDEENPRIPSGGEKLSQRQLIEELVHHENVYDLARDIATTGFVPVESLIGLDEGDKTIIVKVIAASPRSSCSTTRNWRRLASAEIQAGRRQANGSRRDPRSRVDRAEP